MRSTDRENFDSILEMLGRVFRTEITADLRRDYWDALLGEHIESVKKFAHRHRDNGKHFPRPGELKPKVTSQEAATTQDGHEAARERMRQESIQLWEDQIRKDGPIARLKLANALWARYDCELDQRSPTLAEKRHALKQRIGELIRECDPAQVYGEPPLRSLVFALFGEAGFDRLRKLSEANKGAAA